MTPAPLIILTGASGSGKTTVAEEIEKIRPAITVFRFDTIGVPSPSAMAAYGTGHQPGGAWQRAMTLQWLARIAPVLLQGKPVLFEGQMRIAFIQEALKAEDITHARILCVECNDNTRNLRLCNRSQPDLANENTAGWSRYLHQEAIDAGCGILDTTDRPLHESVNRVLSLLRQP